MIDVFERIRYVKKIIQTTFPKMTRAEIRHSLKKIARTPEGKKNELSDTEKAILTLLLRYDIKTGTAYSWYRVLSLPEYLQHEIREHRMSMREAFRANLDNNKPQEVLAEELQSDILKYVDKIAQKDFLRGGEYALK